MTRDSEAAREAQKRAQEAETARQAKEAAARVKGLTRGRAAPTLTPASE